MCYCLGGVMSCKLKKIIKVILPAVPFILLTGCGDSADKRVENAESLIVYGKDFKGASKSLEEALIEYPDNNTIKNLKEDVDEYIHAKELYYENNFDEALEIIESIESDSMEEACLEFEERIEKQKESSKKSSSKKASYLEDAEKISPEEAQFSIDEAFEIFMPYEEVSPNEEEFNNLMAKLSRTPEEEQRFEEIKKTILGASTISSNVYRDSEGIFRIGSQHYLFSNTGERIIYKVYKDKNVEKVER